MKKLTTYNFSVRLEMLDEYKAVSKGNDYMVQIQVLAESQGRARTMLEKWLENPNQTGWKYKTWLGITPMQSDSIIVQDEINIDDYI